jgi:hypothetical protein
MVWVAVKCVEGQGFLVCMGNPQSVQDVTDQVGVGIVMEVVNSDKAGYFFFVFNCF